jgi:hypothetical protein
MDFQKSSLQKLLLKNPFALNASIMPVKPSTSDGLTRPPSSAVTPQSRGRDSCKGVDCKISDFQENQKYKIFKIFPATV